MTATPTGQQRYKAALNAAFNGGGPRRKGSLATAPPEEPSWRLVPGQGWRPPSFPDTPSTTRSTP